jgi:hypothetical protein
VKRTAGRPCELVVRSFFSLLFYDGSCLFPRGSVVAGGQAVFEDGSLFAGH